MIKKYQLMLLSQRIKVLTVMQSKTYVQLLPYKQFSVHLLKWFLVIVNKMSPGG